MQSFAVAELRGAMLAHEKPTILLLLLRRMSPSTHSGFCHRASHEIPRRSDLLPRRGTAIRRASHCPGLEIAWVSRDSIGNATWESPVWEPRSPCLPTADLSRHQFRVVLSMGQKGSAYTPDFSGSRMLGKQREERLQGAREGTRAWGRRHK